jgi:glycerol-3-phosphate dehydrogenase (NAD(P)+)
MLKKIAIIGGGEIGGAISYIASGSGISREVWDKDPAKATVSSPEECLKGAEVVFFCVPSWVVRPALTELSPKLPSGIPLVFVSKGLEPETNLTAPEIAAEFADKERIVFMGGPMIAEEIMEGKGGHAVLGGEKAAVVAEMFRGNNVSAETCPDAFSVSVLGVLKNVYALLIGASEGMGVGDNVKAYLFAKSLDEMDEVSLSFGGTLSSLNPAGIGDLFATGMSRGSSNRKAGFDLALGNAPEKQSEGMASVASVASRLGAKASGLPLMSFVLNMVQSKSLDKSGWENILNA